MNAEDREKAWQQELQRVTHQCPRCATVWLLPHSETQVVCKTCGHRALRQQVALPPQLLATLPRSWQLHAR